MWMTWVVEWWNTLGPIKHTVLKTITEQLQNGKKGSPYPPHEDYLQTCRSADAYGGRVAVAAFHVGACGFQTWEHNATGGAVSGCILSSNFKEVCAVLCHSESQTPEQYFLGPQSHMLGSRA